MTKYIMKNVKLNNDNNIHEYFVYDTDKMLMHRIIDTPEVAARIRKEGDMDLISPLEAHNRGYNDFHYGIDALT